MYSNACVMHKNSISEPVQRNWAVLACSDGGSCLWFFDQAQHKMSWQSIEN